MKEITKKIKVYTEEYKDTYDHLFLCMFASGRGSLVAIPFYEYSEKENGRKDRDKYKGHCIYHDKNDLFRSGDKLKGLSHELLIDEYYDHNLIRLPYMLIEEKNIIQAMEEVILNNTDTYLFDNCFV